VFVSRRYTVAHGQVRTPVERKFEGIRLEGGPNVPLVPNSLISVCEPCYFHEEERHACECMQ
jgi:hypothetical protein